MSKKVSSGHKVIKNYPGRTESEQAGLSANADARTGGTYTKDSRVTNVQRGVTTNIQQGGTHNSVQGDTNESASGGKNGSFGHMWEIIGGRKIWTDGSADEANSTNAPIAAMQAAKPDDGKENMGLTTRLSNIATSITNATTSIDGDKIKMPAPSGNIQVDLLALVDYQRKMLMEYSLKSALKRALLAVKHEVEKMKKQAEETQKMWKRMGKAISDWNLKDLKQIATAPSDEEKKSNMVLTEEEVVKKQLGDSKASRLRQRNNATANL